MIAVLAKAVLFYFLYVFIKNLIVGYKSYQHIKGQMGPNLGGNKKKSKYKPHNNDDVVEAEYRVIKD